MGFVGGRAGEPTAVKVFMMWQKLIMGLGAKSKPYVTATVCFCDTPTCLHRGTDGHRACTTYLHYSV